MSLPGDFTEEMQRLPLDLDTADRLLAGSVAPEDAPPGYAGLAFLLTSAGDCSAIEESVAEAEIVAFLAAAVRSSHTVKTRARRRSIVPRIKLAAALAATALVGTTGAAVAGSLPGAAQDIASTMLEKVGITVPGPDDHAGDHPNTRGQSTEHSPAPSSPSGKGSEISDLATSTDLTGVDKGAAISTAASNGKSRAGQEHPAPVATPSAGGTATAEAASDGKSSTGVTTADEASSGRSSAGSGNAADGQSQRP